MSTSAPSAKIEAFADDTRVKVKQKGTETITTRASERAFAPVSTIGLAGLQDRAGADLRKADIQPDRRCWFEVAYWIQSARILVEPEKGTASEENRHLWPAMTLQAVKSAEDADPRQRDRVFALAVTRSMQVAPMTGPTETLWGHAADQICFNDGRGRLLVVSAGNARDTEWLTLAEQYPQLHLSEKIHEPAQATNVLTVGAFTNRVDLPPHKAYAEARPVAPTAGVLSPFSSTGPLVAHWPIKPDVVLEGGNLAIAPGPLLDEKSRDHGGSDHRSPIPRRSATILALNDE
ncbi:MAG: S8 family serine peptidase [Myxococcaceae bacterium]